MTTLANPLSIAGSRDVGRDVRTQNVMAASSIANIVKSSLGPVVSDIDEKNTQSKWFSYYFQLKGLDKMLVDDVGDVTVTNDGATILKLLEVEHPAAKVSKKCNRSILIITIRNLQY